jgi:hypothetical protein
MGAFLFRRGKKMEEKKIKGTASSVLSRPLGLLRTPVSELETQEKEEREE